MDELEHHSTRIMGLRAMISTHRGKGYVTGQAGDHQVMIDCVEDYGDLSEQTIRRAEKEVERRLRGAIQRERDDRATRYRRR